MVEALALATAFLTLIGATGIVTAVDIIAWQELDDLAPVQVAIPAVVIYEKG